MPKPASSSAAPRNTPVCLRNSLCFTFSEPRDDRSELRRLQRAQIYALNEAMTAFELANFEAFMARSVLDEPPLESGADSSFDSEG
jgi:hypothetical protein